MLHLIFSPAGLQRAQKHMASEDAVVFLEDGCYVAQPVPGLTTHILDSHAKSRAVEIVSPLAACSMSDLIDMIAQHEKSISWK